MDIFKIRTNSLLKREFKDLPPIPNSSDIINFWLTWEHKEICSELYVVSEPCKDGKNLWNEWKAKRNRDEITKTERIKHELKLVHKN